MKKEDDHLPPRNEEKRGPLAAEGCRKKRTTRCRGMKKEEDHSLPKDEERRGPRVAEG
ncbi:hypothetical protein TcasGA2_TC009096 [Tribolium castaneum]|uniref:Uncharacterized protein n=1 Tax=Tribolium castaneum TaxID=7070 RepID=D6WP78_TRICA|nr:hypothetical protein TcasGA2_TC009096 [Tribolium castaneum]